MAFVRLSRYAQGLLTGLTIASVPLLILALYLSVSPKNAAVVLPHPRTSTPSPTEGSSPTPDENTSPATPSSGKAGNSALAAFFAPDFSGKTFCKFSHQHVGITGSTLTATYLKGSSAPSAGAPYGGAQLCVPFANGSATDVTLTYDVRFPVGFEWVKGGKLPGVYGGKEPFSGGSHNPNGWSMRLMWRENGAAEVYGYISTSTGYGEDWTGGGLAFTADGKWHHLAEHVHLNSPGQSDGNVTLSYDGTQYINKTGLAITTTNTPVTGLFFSSFYGGHDPTWSPSADMHIDFANFKRS
jgi:hypothetical protein